jgi:hypothetical protein
VPETAGNISIKPGWEAEMNDPCINCTSKLAPYVDCPCPVKREWEEKQKKKGFCLEAFFNA